MYNLFLDDMRQPSGVKWIPMPDGQWIIARDYESFVKVIKEKGIPNFIAFDHELGSGYMPGWGWQIEEKSGLDCAKWFVEYCMENKKIIPEWGVHCINPIAKENINAVMNMGRKIQTQ